MDKTALHRAILAALQSELALLTEAANTARDEATDEESRAEDRFDMRSQSAAYLAAGQAKLVGDITAAIEAFEGLVLKAFGADEPIATGALITLQEGRRHAHYFLGPQHGGLEVKFNDSTVMVVTGASPLGRQLVGRKAGEKVMLPGRPRPTLHTIVAVA